MIVRSTGAHLQHILFLLATLSIKSDIDCLSVSKDHQPSHQLLHIGITASLSKDDSTVYRCSPSTHPLPPGHLANQVRHRLPVCIKGPPAFTSVAPHLGLQQVLVKMIVRSTGAHLQHILFLLATLSIKSDIDCLSVSKDHQPSHQLLHIGITASLSKDDSTVYRCSPSTHPLPPGHLANQVRHRLPVCIKGPPAFTSVAPHWDYSKS